MKNDKINRFLRIALNGASIADDADPINNDFFNALGCGIRSYSNYTREGVKAVIDLQEENVRLKDKVKFLEGDLEIYREFESIIDVGTIEMLSEDEKAKVVEFINSLFDKEEIKNEKWRFIRCYKLHRLWRSWIWIWQQKKITYVNIIYRW